MNRLLTSGVYFNYSYQMEALAVSDAQCRAAGEFGNTDRIDFTPVCRTLSEYVASGAITILTTPVFLVKH